jgi:hypothetical protein
MPGTKIVTGSLPATALGDNSVPGTKVQDGTIPTAKLVDRRGVAHAFGLITSGALAWGWNVTSVTKSAVGQYSVQLAPPASSAVYSHVLSAYQPGFASVNGSNAQSFGISLTNAAGAAADGLVFFASFAG